eukprot:gene989-4231_t
MSKSVYFTFIKTIWQRRRACGGGQVQSSTPYKQRNHNCSCNYKMASQWNSAGTWEERDVSEWAMQTLKELVQDITVQEATHRISISKVSKCVGEARKLIVRGQPRAGFEFKLELNFKGSSNGSPVSGIVRISEVSETDVDDFEVSVDLTNGDINASSLEESFQAAIATALHTFYAQLKAL